MAAKRIGIMDIRQIINLKIKGLSNRKISMLTGLHRNSVNTYVQAMDDCPHKYEELQAFSDEELFALFPNTSTVKKERYETLSTYFEHYKKELKKTGCTKFTLWEKYKEQHPEGYGRSQFNLHFNRWLERKEGSGKLNHIAGDTLFVDYTGKHLQYIDRETGEVIEVEVFVGILPCSGYTFVEASPSQKLPDFIRSMNNCLRFFGGVPQAIVPDNLKSAVTKSSRYQPILNKTFKDFALHYDCAINPARAIKPRDKALVENAVKIVYQRIFYPLSKMTFFSIHDINNEISKLLEQYNDYLLTNLNVSRRQQFLDLEQQKLSPLPAENYEIRYFKRATVQKMGYIFLSEDKNYYSVPHRFIGKKVEVSYNSQSVDIQLDGMRVATHKRSYKAGHYVTVKEHLSSAHNFYNEWSPEFFEKQAAKLGEHTRAYVKALIKSKIYPETAYKQCLGIINLKKSYPINRIETVCQQALGMSRHSYLIVEQMLRNNMDQLDGITTQSGRSHIPPHDNIRGADAFA